ncbi:delta-60 repeat domain-containing protein [Candidatus Kryptobacter tengchongensis]|nr:delta-60 repeat domain-containing protein [Candidatus Kryptobacter tengchongensis]
MKVVEIIAILAFSVSVAFSGGSFTDEKPEIFVQLGHTDDVTSVAISSDGKYIVSGSQDKTIKLWDISTGREIRTFKGHTDWITSVAISPDGKYVISGSYDKTLKIWDILTGREIRTFAGHTDKVTSVAITPDGKYIVSGSQDKTIKLWDISTGREIRTFKGHTNWVTSVAVSPDGKYVISGSNSWIIKLWDISTGKEIRTFAGHEGLVTSVAISPDGKYVVSGSSDNAVKLWDISTGREIRTFKGHTDWITSVAISPDGKYVASGSQDKTIKLWDISTGMEIRTFKGHAFQVTSVAITPDGRYVVSGSWDKTIKLWDISTGMEVITFKGQPIEKIKAVAISPDGRYVISGEAGWTLRLWDINTGKGIRTFKQTSWITSVAITPDGKYVAFGGSGGTIKLWDISTGREIRTFEGHTSEITSVAITPDGKYVVSGSWDKTIKLWDISTGREIRTFEGHGDYVTSVAVSPDGRYVISGSEDGTAKLWDITTDREIRKFEGYAGRITVAISPDGKFAIIGDVNGKLILWRGSVFSTFEKLTNRVEINDWVNSIAITPDGKYVISGHGDKTIRLWDISTTKEIRRFEGHTDEVTSVSISSEGRYVVSGSYDGTIRMWDINTGKEIAQFIGFEDGEWVVITPEGYFNASENGARYINVSIGKNVYSIDNFFEKFCNPVYVASVLQGKRVEVVADIRQGVLAPPEVKIVYPMADATLSTDTLTVTIYARDMGGGIDEIRLYHNGKVVGEERRGIKLVSGEGEVVKSYSVTLVDGVNIFRAVGFSRDRTESNPYEIVVKLTAPKKDVSLYVFVVGINRYKNTSLNLNYAEPDARSIAQFFRERGGRLFKEVKIIELYNEYATKDAIISNLGGLGSTNPQDAVVVYLAGHGENARGEWYFIPHELTYPEREEELINRGVSSRELADLIRGIGAQKVLVMIDACKSGGLVLAMRGLEDRKALSQLSRSTGVHVIAASTKEQFAAEVGELGHGVFTYTILEGLNGKASGGTETVTVRKLMGYVEEQLPEITKKYRQEAQYPIADSKGQDFPLAIVK